MNPKLIEMCLGSKAVSRELRLVKSRSMLHNAGMSSSSPIASRYKPKVEERRRRVITATTALAVEGGFAAVRSRAICEKANVSMGTLYRDFSSLEEILLIGFAEQF